jgi:isopenicillin N synthase-like dioxygenase
MVEGRSIMAVVLQTPQQSPVDSVIPVIDIGPYRAGVPGALATAATELRQALEGLGFFILINHGVPTELIARTFAAARRFHAQPLDAKMALRMNEHNNGRSISSGL